MTRNNTGLTLPGILDFLTSLPKETEIEAHGEFLFVVILWSQARLMNLILIKPRRPKTPNNVDFSFGTRILNTAPIKFCSSCAKFVLADSREATGGLIPAGESEKSVSLVFAVCIALVRAVKVATFRFRRKI
jgi:hypothetical protein